MEREGSGFDKMYEVLLVNGKHIPIVKEYQDRVTVTVSKRIIGKEVVKLMDRASKEYQLRMKETISLGLVAQHRTINATEFAQKLNLNEKNAVRSWLGRLEALGLIIAKGRTKGKKYEVNPKYLKKLDFKGKVNLKTIEMPRLKELILETMKTYAPCSISDIHTRIGKDDIPLHLSLIHI